MSELTEGCFFSKNRRLGFCRCAHRADTGAGTAADALIAVDDHIITFGNAADRALTNTSAASNTSIFINNVCHEFPPLVVIHGFFSDIYYMTKFTE